MTLLGVVLWGFLAAAAITDVRWQIIPNRVTYTGIMAALLIRGTTSGWSGLEEGLKGVAACGLIMLVCFVLLGVGGGDVKLIAMMGAFLGVERGFETLLWTLVLGGMFGVAVLIWQVGLVNLLVGMGKHLILMWRAKGWVPLNRGERTTLKQPLFLAPAALVAALIVGWY